MASLPARFRSLPSSMPQGRGFSYGKGAIAKRSAGMSSWAVVRKCRPRERSPTFSLRHTQLLHGANERSASGSNLPFFQRRSLGLFAITTVPVLLLGVVIAKCIIIVAFQDKLVYMSSMPPFARSEKIEDYASMCDPVKWEEKRIESLDGTQLALAVGGIPASSPPESKAVNGHKAKRVVVLYFQGNAGSTPPHLPMLSSILRSLHSSSPCSYTIIALAYRSYWHSSGTASEKGLNLDAAAALQWAARTYPATATEDVSYMLWGQSLGTAVSNEAAARNAENPTTNIELAAVLLETPSYALKALLQGMYPQKYLPYRYLGPLLWNKWDSKDALRRLAAASQKKKTPKIKILQAENDELIPLEHGVVLEQCARQLGLDVEREVVRGATHNDIPSKTQGREAILRVLREVGEGGS